MLEIQCHRCATHFKLPDDWAGKRGKCPKCDCVLSIPPAAAPASPPPGKTSPPPPPPPAPPKTVAPQSGSPANTALGGLRSRLADVRNLPLPWRIGIAAGATLLLLGLVVFALRGSDPDPAGDLADAGDGRSEPPPAGQEGPGLPATPNGPYRPTDPNQPDPVAPGRANGTTPRPDDARPPRDEPPSAQPNSGGIVGVSNEYTDRDCRLLQARYAVRVPAAATILEVDGLRLPILNPARLAESRSPLLFLPRGTHWVRFRANEPIQVTIRSDLFGEYQRMRRFFDVGGRVRGEALIDRGARAADVHGTPFLLNFAGASYAGANEWDVAERKFRRSLSVNPLFGPAHLNLAECLLRRGLRAEAAREVELADFFNVGNVFGLAGAIAQFRRRLAIPIEWGEPIDVETVAYLSEEALSQEDLRLRALIKGISKYAVSDADRGKILNNLAVHLADRGYPEMALHHFRDALEVIRFAEPAERYALTRKVFSNMSEVCRRAGFAEADEYRRMRLEVKP